jgi:hypothetical protein
MLNVARPTIMPTAEDGNHPLQDDAIALSHAHRVRQVFGDRFIPEG